MKKILIAAIDINCGLGKNGTLPWHYPADLRQFRSQTLDETVVMGMGTFLGLKDRGLAPLDRRRNIVVTSKVARCREAFANRYHPRNLTFTDDIHCRDVKLDPDSDLYYIGGATIYAQVLYSVALDRICLSRFDRDYGCDVFFPRVAVGRGFQPDIPFVYKLASNYKVPGVDDGRDFSISTYQRNLDPEPYS